MILQGIRVLDFTWVLAGPYTTRLLADFGAEVIKVQPLLPAEDERTLSHAYYNQWNRNKLSVSLNLNTVEGIELLKKLVAISDIVVENFSPRVMANWHLNYENLKKIRSDVIMLSMSVMGQTGPQREYTGFGATVQALSGMTGLSSFNTQKPVGPGFSYADHVAGLYASLAILAALEHRNRTQEGQYIDLSQVETMASLLGGAVMEAAAGKETGLEGNGSSIVAPHNVYRCRDGGWVAISISSEEKWHRLLQAMGSPDELDNERYDTAAKHMLRREKLDELINRWTQCFTASEMMTLLQECGVDAGVVQNAADLFRDPQLGARDFFVQLGDGLTDSTPIRLSRTPAVYCRPAPVAGQDNDYVYEELLGISDEEISSLKDKGVI